MTIEKLAELPSVFKKDGTVMPGNVSQIVDGAADLLLTSRAFADEHDLDVLADIGHHHVAGVDPEVMDIGPIPACEGLFERAGLPAYQDIDHDHRTVIHHERYVSEEGVHTN